MIKAKLAPLGLPIQIVNESAMTKEMPHNVVWEIERRPVRKRRGIPETSRWDKDETVASCTRKAGS